VLSDTIEKLEKIINTRAAVRIKRKGNFTLAAVMMMIREEKDDYSILFIKRFESASDLFSGHMAFPGGKMDKTDRDILETAIRETLEETGVDLKKSGRILGQLDDFNPVNPRANHYIVTPYVAFLGENIELRLNAMEVARALWIPISHLKDEKNSETRILEKYGTKRKDFVFYYENYVIWGMTARILRQFLRLAGYLFKGSEEL
jgi:ADP-ribose pyrophosphatase